MTRLLKISILCTITGCLSYLNLPAFPPPEKERYLGSFLGSNELDIKMRDKREGGLLSPSNRSYLSDSATSESEDDEGGRER